MSYTVAVSNLRLPDRDLDMGDELTEDDLPRERLDEMVETGKLDRDDEVNYPRRTGGGWFELSDGSRVQGREAAEAAEGKI